MTCKTFKVYKTFSKFYEERYQAHETVKPLILDDFYADTMCLL
jgi:hypothetical protein